MAEYMLSLLLIIVMLSISTTLNVYNPKFLRSNDLFATITFTTFGSPLSILLNGKELSLEGKIESYPLDERLTKNENLSTSFNISHEMPTSFDRPHLTFNRQSELPTIPTRHDQFEIILTQKKAKAVYFDDNIQHWYSVSILMGKTPIHYGDVITIVYQNIPLKQKGLIGQIEIVNLTTKDFEVIVTGDKWVCNNQPAKVITKNIGDIYQVIPLYSQSSAWIDDERTSSEIRCSVTIKK